MYRGCKVVVVRCRPNGGHPRPYGYTLRMTPPHVQTQEDVEGVGLCNITPRTTHFACWFKYRRDAEHHAAVWNAQA